MTPTEGFDPEFLDRYLAWERTREWGLERQSADTSSTHPRAMRTLVRRDSGVRAASTSNVSLTYLAPHTAIDVPRCLDGVVLEDDDCVLLKNQDAAVENGVWRVEWSGSDGGAGMWSRRDLDPSNDPVRVLDGVVNAGSSWVDGRQVVGEPAGPRWPRHPRHRCSCGATFAAEADRDRHCLRVLLEPGVTVVSMDGNGPGELVAIEEGRATIRSLPGFRHRLWHSDADRVEPIHWAAIDLVRVRDRPRYWRRWRRMEKRRREHQPDRVTVSTRHPAPPPPDAALHGVSCSCNSCLWLPGPGGHLRTPGHLVAPSPPSPGWESH